MKKVVLLFCISLMILSLWGCSGTPAEPDDSSVQSSGDESSVPMMELYAFGDTISVPAEIKNGDLLPGDFVYFDRVSVKSTDDILAMFSELGIDPEEGIAFVTPEYYGAVRFIDGLWCVAKECEYFTEEALYDENGLVRHIRQDYITEEEPPVPEILEHGIRDKDGRVYIDTDIVDIDSGIDLTVFLDLVDIFYGGCSPDLWYEFFTDDNSYSVRINPSNQYVISVSPLDTSGEYTQSEYLYEENREFYCMKSSDYANGNYVRSFFMYENGDTEEMLYPEEGVFVETKIIGGTETTRKYHSTDEGSFTDYYYKSGRKEVFLTYDESGTKLIGYKAISIPDNEIYDWVLDGNGYDIENFVSVTITRNGSSVTYVGKDEIPWGAAIYYPPRFAGGYE